MDPDYVCKSCGGCVVCFQKFRDLLIELHDTKQRLAALVYKVPEFVDSQTSVNAPTEFTENPGVYPEDQPMSNTELEVRLKKIREDRLKQDDGQGLGGWSSEDETEGIWAVREAAQVDALLSNNNVKG